MDPLYLNDTELAEKLNIGAEKLSMLRAEPGFPAKDPLVKKRFWPEVEAWLFLRHRISANIAAEPPDGKEDWS